MEKLFKVGDIISPKPGRFQHGGKEITGLTDCAYKMRGGFTINYEYAHENYELPKELKIGDLVKIDYEHPDWSYSWDRQPPTEFDVLEISGFTPRQQAAYFVGHDIAYSYPQSVLIKVEKPEVKVPLPTPKYAEGDIINCTKVNGCKIEFVMINPDGVEYGVRECGSEDTFTIKEEEVRGLRYDLGPEKKETTEFEVGDVVEIASKWLTLFKAGEIGQPFTIIRVNPLSSLSSRYHEVKGFLGTAVYIAEEDIKKKVNNNNTKIDNDEYDTKEEGINLPRKKSYLSRGEIEGRTLK